MLMMSAIKKIYGLADNQNMAAGRPYLQQYRQGTGFTMLSAPDEKQVHSSKEGIIYWILPDNESISILPGNGISGVNY
jgi:hypothetical protein